MPGTPTTRWGLRKPALSDSADAPRDFSNLADDCDSFAKHTQGLLANRPAAAANKYGSFYYATDSGETFLDDGGTWRRIHPPTDGTVTTAILANAAVTDAKLASPNNGVYRRIVRATGRLPGNTGGGAALLLAFVSGGAVTNDLSDAGAEHEMLDLRAADLAVAGLTTKLRLHASIICNGTAPGVTLTFGLYPITAGSGGVAALSFTVGTAVATAAINATSVPPAGTYANSADIALPADGLYLFGVVASGASATNSVTRMLWQVDVRNV